MDALLRELREGPDGIAEYYDTEISSKELTIGSAADRNIQLLGRGIAGEHAIIRQAGAQLVLECRRGEYVRINGKKKESARLSVGDVIELGGHLLRIAQPPPGFSAAIELQPNDQIDASTFESAFRTDLSQTWLGKRAMAWAGVVVVLVFGLLLPLLVFKAHRADNPVPAWFPGDKFWNSGPLHQVHQQAIGDRCDTCHEKLFQRVQDSACETCHRTTHDHIMPARLALTELGPTPRCATCHREHNEPQTFLVNNSDSSCIDCHGEPEHGFGQIKIDPVNGFDLERHPEFEPHLLASVAAPAGRGFAYDWKTVVAELDKAMEQSNLKFSHRQHLDPNRVLRRGDSKPMNCADCHSLEPDGEHFEPITQEKQCAQCHELTFDPTAPDRQLPHGKPREVVLTLQDYFTRKFSDPNFGRVATRERRRLPGQEREEETCTGEPFDCAMRSARKEIESQFTRRGCIGCHAVIDTQVANVFDRFQVVPIRFARDYFPANRFDHRSHQIQGKLTGDDACLSCHAAKKSQDSSDLMVPGITKCTECHADKATVEKVTVQCVSCHEYHPREPKLLDALSTQITPQTTRRETETEARGELAGS
ncbi:MAG TPA: FHA domain-containing protein [Steroidobacter sp.]|uniref:FHA domain-containing protein n=1 Tax=Steroidobacter sp. TaxID=1978227 RepID=UPI002EDB0C54